jgi:DNA repair exonuclease SbcCD ATPase subunit
MPRIKPARTIEEVNAVPQDKSVTISLEPEGTVVLDREADEAALKAQEEADLKKKAKAKEENEDDEVSDLKQQLEDLRKAGEASNKRIQDEMALRQAAEQRVREREQEASQSKIRAEDAEYDAILNAIGAAESEAESAQRDIALATEASDAKAVAEASRKLARAESRLSQLEDGKTAIERAKTAAIEQAKRNSADTTTTTTTQKATTVDQYIDQLPNLLPSQRDWLREHPDSLTDTRKNLRLQGAHVEAEDKGFRPGTTKYFNYLEQRLGYIDVEEHEDGMEDNDTPRTPVSAPPSRSATNPATGRPSGTRITLTPEQREIARLSGIDEITYARQLQRMNELKANGQLQ